MARWDQVNTAIIIIDAKDFSFILHSYLLPISIQKRRIVNVAILIITEYYNNGSGRI